MATNLEQHSVRAQAEKDAQRGTPVLWRHTDETLTSRRICLSQSRRGKRECLGCGEAYERSYRTEVGLKVGRPGRSIGFGHGVPAPGVGASARCTRRPSFTFF